ncbi:MAG: U32 family peptidase [Roseiarcus sp.]|jgi:collagenase-like PrtC family protease
MSALTLGPILFNWKRERRRDFYFRIADEAPIDCVYLGEVVCSKREPFFVDDLPAIAERLSAAGKQVALSTLALVTTDREMEAIRERCGGELMIEANDVASVKLLAGAPYIAGPFINVFNEATLDFLVRGGAVRVNTPVELSGAAVATLARHSPVETETLVFGRQPLSISMRCYHARAYGLTKDSCQFVCELDPDGLAADQLDGKRLLVINGTQTLSHGYAALLSQLDDLQSAGVTHFRLSPQATDMVRVAELYRAALDRRIAAEEALAGLRALVEPTPFVNGYIRGREGMSWSESAAGSQ